jgi:hypothetical protein
MVSCLESGSGDRGISESLTTRTYLINAFWPVCFSSQCSDFEALSPDAWLQRQRSVSEEDFAKNPTRNRLVFLLNRTNHMSYHLGQALLASK